MSERIGVLHVDDDPDFAELAALSLEREDDRFDVTTAGSAEAGHEHLAESEVDCIVSDYEMPGTNGIEFLEAVREDHPDLPFILFTGEGSEAIASDAISAGTTDYLQKGAGTDQYTVLANRIENAVEQYRTEQRLRERERELARQNNRLRSLFESFPEPTLEYVYEDGEPYVVDVNEAFASVFGFDADEAVGEHVDDLVVPPDRREEARDIDERVRAGESVDEVLRRETADGLRTFRFRNVRLPDDEDIDGYAIYADVTDRVRREQQLERKNERLDEFASVVSHDLRNPLKVAKGRLSLAREDCDSEHLDDVARAHERMEALIEDLLAFAREDDPVEDASPVALAELVETAWRNVRTADASLTVDADLTVMGDRTRLERLLENLLGNAVDHGGDDVSVRVGALDEGRGFYVADDGPGIPEDRREAVFESGHSTTEEGTGLGLAIAEEIAAAHGWEVAVTDGIDGGARFEITGVDVED